MPTMIGSPSGAGNARKSTPPASGAAVSVGSVSAGSVSVGSVSAVVVSTAASVSTGASVSDELSESLPQDAATSAMTAKPASART
jgi:hypothetical protein